MHITYHNSQRSRDFARCHGAGAWERWAAIAGAADGRFDAQQRAFKIPGSVGVPAVAPHIPPCGKQNTYKKLWKSIGFARKSIHTHTNANGDCSLAFPSTCIICMYTYTYTNYRYLYVMYECMCIYIYMYIYRYFFICKYTCL